MKTILMLTAEYPFGKSETFIENETDILAGYADRLIIISCGAPDTGAARAVPKNARVICIPAKSRFADAAHIPYRMARQSDVLRDELRHCGGMARKLFAAYFEAKSRRIFESLKDVLDFSEFEDDDVYIYSYWMFATAYVGAMIKKELGGTVVRTFTRAHKYDLYEYGYKTNYLPMRRYIMEEYDDILPCSDDGAEYLSGRYPRYAKKIRAAYLGTRDYGTGRGSDDGVLRIVSCSRMAAEKRVGLITDVIEMLERDGIDVKWTHIGGGKLEEKIKADATRRLKEGTYEFKGNLANRSVLEFYKSQPVDLFINASSGEGLPVAVMEAASFGIPAVVTDVGGEREIIRNGYNGMMFPKDFKPRDMANGIKALTESERGRMRTAAREVWERRFCAADNYKRLFDELIGGERG